MAFSFGADIADPSVLPGYQAPPQAPTAPHSGGLAGFLHGLIQGPETIAKGLFYAPQALYREVQNKPIGDIQQKAFGTQNQGQIAKDIIGGDLQTMALVGAPELKGAGLGAKVAQGARLGGLAGFGSGLQNNQNLLESTALGAGTGAAVPVGLRALGFGKGVARNVADSAAADATPAGNVKDNFINRRATKAAQTDIQRQAEAEQFPYKTVPKGSLQNGIGMNAILRFAKNVGMQTDPTSLHAINNFLTSDNGVLSQHMREILDPINNVDTSNVEKAAINELGRRRGDLGNYESKSAAQGTLGDIRNILEAHNINLSGVDKTGAPITGILDKTNAAGATLANKSNANDVFDAMQELERRGNTALSGNEKAQAQGAVFKAAQKELESQLFNHAGVSKAIRDFKLSPEEENAIMLRAQQGGLSPKLGQYAIDALNNSNTGQELRALQKPAVDAGALAEAGDKATSGVLTKAPEQKTGFFDRGNAASYYGTKAAADIMTFHNPIQSSVYLGHRGISPLLDKLAGKIGTVDTNKIIDNPATRAMSPAEEAAQKLAAGGEAPPPPTGGGSTGPLSPQEVDQKLIDQFNTPPPTASSPVVPALSRAGSSGQVAQALTTGTVNDVNNAANANQQYAQQQQARQKVLDSNAALMGPQSSTDTNATNGTATGPPLTNSGMNISPQQLMEAMAADPQHASTYLDLYKTFNTQQKSDLTTTQQKAISGGEGAIAALQSYLSQIEQAASGVGGNVATGTIANLLGHYDPVASKADKAAYALSSSNVDTTYQIAQGLSGGNKPNTSTLQMVAKSMPLITDSPQLRQDKVNFLVSRIQDYMQAEAIPVSQYQAQLTGA